MNWKRIGKRLLFPPIWVILILTVLSTVALVLVFVKGWESLQIAIVVYVLAFYSLVILCLCCWKTIPPYYKYVKQKVYANEYANKYFTDATFKTHIGLYGSFTINLIYIVVNVVSAVVYSTFWFAIFATYYAVMASMRFLLVRYMRRNQIGKSRLGELKCSRACACILMTVNLVLSGVVLMMIYFNRSFQYQGYLIYVMALYTFYITTTAVRDLIRYRKYHSPVMSVTKIIKLAAALFSMLFLETAMFSQFGEDTSPKLQKNMIMATGGGISVIVVTMAVYMIVSTTKEIRKNRRSR